MDRYQVREGSQTAHCCFTHTVVDTAKRTSYNGYDGKTPHYEVVCECFDQEAAEVIVIALNNYKGDFDVD